MGLTLSQLTTQTSLYYKDFLSLMVGQYFLLAGAAFLSISWLVRRALVGDSKKVYRVLNNRPLKLPLSHISAQDVGMYTGESPNKSKTSKPSDILLVFYYASRLLMVISAFLFIFFFALIGGLEFILDEYTGSLLGFSACQFMVLYLLYLENPVRLSESSFIKTHWDVLKKSFWNSRLFYISFEAFAVLASLSLLLVFRKTCICFYNEDTAALLTYGKDALLSTWLSRRLLVEPSCPQQSGPCHVYLTLPENSTHFAFLNGNSFLLALLNFH